jgi:ABC-2 type transport system permease protein
MGISGINPNRRYIPSNMEYTLAARIEGAPAEAPRPNPADPKNQPARPVAINAIIIGDLDLISEQFFEIRRQKIKNLEFDNVTFVLNCVDVLAGDDAYIALRKRRPRYRTLTGLEQQTRTFAEKGQKETRQAEEDAEEAIKKAQKSLDDKVAKIRDDKELNERDKEIKLLTLEKVENRRLDVEKAAIQDEKRRKIQTSKAEMEQSIRQIENRVRVGAAVASPLPALILALVIFGARAGRENRGANPNRLA